MFEHQNIHGEAATASPRQRVLFPLCTFFLGVVAGEVDEDAAIHDGWRGFAATGAGWHHGQRQYQGEIIIRRDAVEPLEAAAQAAMHEHVFVAGALERTDGRHPRGTGVQPVARLTRVDMARMQTEGAMVAVPPARWHGCDEAATVHALEDALGRVASRPPHRGAGLVISIVEIGRLVAIRMSQG